jgi:signal transduction histidine kinase
VRAALRSLRVRLAVLGFLASYLPALLLFGVILATRVESTSEVVTGVGVVRTTSTHREAWLTATVLALAPVAAALAWWWAGRAVRPIQRVRRAAEAVQATDLSRRIGLARGPTEVVELAAAFDALLDRLERAADLQGRLVEEASHELRMPLSVLLTNAEVLLAHPEPTVELYRQGLRRSGEVAARLQATVGELLVDARGRARAVARRPADLTALVGRVAAEAGVLAARRSVRLAVAGPAAAPCAVDEPTVRRAVANLVDNAIRYGPAGSVVEVRVELADAEAAVVVTDHGAGIPAAEQARVLDRFWRGRPDVPGTGLGLPIARQIARAHGGDLTLRSPGPAGDGCQFRLTLRR